MAQKGLISAGQALFEAEIVSPEPIMRSTKAFGPNRSEEPASPHAPGADLRKQSENHLLAAFSADFDPSDGLLSHLEEPYLLTWFPTEIELLRYETKIVTSAGKRLLSHGQAAAYRRFEAFLGPLSIGERRDYLALGYAHARQLTAGSMDDDRALAVARYEDLIGRAKQALDLRVELAASRALSTVQGLTSADVDKSQRDLIFLLGSKSHDRATLSFDEAKDAEVVPRIRALPG